MAYVAVPSLSKAEKALYKDDGESGKRKLDSIAQAERAPRNPIFEALSAGLQHNGSHIQTYVSSKAKGKARAVTVDTDSDDAHEESDESDYGTIFVSRPLKRKTRSRETDDDDRSYGSPPRKRKNIRPSKGDSASGSSPHIPLSQALSKTKTKMKTVVKAKTGPEAKAKRSDRDILLLEVGDLSNPPSAMLPSALATSSFLRHLRMIYTVDGAREKMWETRYNAGDAYPEPIYLVDDIDGPSSPKEKTTKAESHMLNSALSPATAQSGPLPGGGKEDKNGPGATRSEQCDHDASISPSTVKKRGRGRPKKIRAVESLSPKARPSYPTEGEGVNARAKVTLSLSDKLTNDPPREMDIASTSADAEGDVDMEYFLNDLGNHSAAAGTGTVLPNNVVNNKEQDEINERRSPVPMPMTTIYSPTSADPLSSLNIYSFEGHVHADHPNQSTMNDTDIIQPNADPFLSGPDGPDNGDDAFYSTPNDFTSSPWVSGAEGDYQTQSPVGAMAGSSANGAWNGTIDPSLLGGGELESQPLTPSPSPPPPTVRGGLSNAVASSSRLPVNSYSDFFNALPHRRHSSQRPRRLQNYIDIDDLDLSARSESESESEVSSHDFTGRFDYASDSKYESDASDFDNKPSRVVPAMRIPEGSTSTSRSTSRNIPEVAPPISAPKPVARKKGKRKALTKDTPGVTWCHQCRRNTFHDKMKCSNTRPDGNPCDMRFCTICVEKRYVVCYYLSHFCSFVSKISEYRVRRQNSGLCLPEMHEHLQLHRLHCQERRSLRFKSQPRSWSGPGPWPWPWPWNLRRPFNASQK